MSCFVLETSDMADLPTRGNRGRFRVNSEKACEPRSNSYPRPACKWQLRVLSLDYREEPGWSVTEKPIALPPLSARERNCQSANSSWMREAQLIN
jgi:hypothetical protein